MERQDSYIAREEKHTSLDGLARKYLCDWSYSCKEINIVLHPTSSYQGKMTVRMLRKSAGIFGKEESRADRMSKIFCRRAKCKSVIFVWKAWRANIIFNEGVKINFALGEKYRGFFIKRWAIYFIKSQKSNPRSKLFKKLHLCGLENSASQKYRGLSLAYC